MRAEAEDPPLGRGQRRGEAGGGCRELTDGRRGSRVLCVSWRKSSVHSEGRDIPCREHTQRPSLTPGGGVGEWGSGGALGTRPPRTESAEIKDFIMCRSDTFMASVHQTPGRRQHEVLYQDGLASGLCFLSRRCNPSGRRPPPLRAQRCAEAARQRFCWARLTRPQKLPEPSVTGAETAPGQPRPKAQHGSKESSQESSLNAPLSDAPPWRHPPLQVRGDC